MVVKDLEVEAKARVRYEKLDVSSYTDWRSTAQLGGVGRRPVYYHHSRKYYPRHTRDLT